MITNIVDGDITDASNTSDIIIAMNTELGELTPLGRRFLGDEVPQKLCKLGSILTFDFSQNPDRLIHMAVCHNLCENGWRSAPGYLRYCLDTLWVQAPERSYSVVEIGRGPVGIKYGVDSLALRKAMEESYLELTLFRLLEGAKVLAIDLPPLRFLYGHASMTAFKDTSPERLIAA